MIQFSSKFLIITICSVWAYSFLVSCNSGGKRLDCSNVESYTASIEEMKKEMQEEEKAKFDATIVVITMSGIAKLSNGKKMEADSSPEEMAMEILGDYCGLTANQIMKKAERMK